jgi:hypothetical protein
MIGFRWLIVPAIVFVLGACSLEATDTGGETNWLHCERDDDCQGSASCINQRCMSVEDDGGNGSSTSSGGITGSGGTANGAGAGGSSGLTTGGSAGTPAGGSAGMVTGGNGGSGDLTCGPDLVATWTGAMPGLPEGWSDPEHDDCWNLMFYDYEDGSLGVSSRLSQVSPDLQYTLTLHFASDGNQDGTPGGPEDQVYETRQEVKGPITQSFGPECMIYGDREVACEELSEPLTNSGIGEGSWLSVVCMPAANGGCDCLLDYWGVGGETGTWQLVDDRVVLSRLDYSLDGTDFTEVMSDPIDYCATSDTLRFGTAVNAWWNDLADVDLTRIDCDDGAAGPGEQGIDCGYNCPAYCP